MDFSAAFHRFLHKHTHWIMRDYELIMIISVKGNRLNEHFGIGFVDDDR